VDRSNQSAKRRQRWEAMTSTLTEAPRGGYQKVYGFQGRRTAWVSRADFFCWRRTFEFAFENQTIQSRAHAESFQGLGSVPPPRWACAFRNLAHLFSDRTPPGGWSKVWDSADRDRWASPFFSSGNWPNLFFSTAPAAAPGGTPGQLEVACTILDAARSQKNAAKFRVGGVGRSEMT
jgi:hypothetical protein